MKNESHPNHPERPTSASPSRKLFGRGPIPFFGKKGHIPVSTQQAYAGGKWSRSSLFWLALVSVGILLFLLKCKRETLQKAEGDLVDLVYENFLFQHEDCDYLLFAAATTCGYQSVLMKDYQEYQDQGDVETQTVKLTAKKNLPQRPRINMDQLAYFEKLTRDRVRLIYDNGACEIFDFQDLLYNIQEQQQCSQFRGIPQNGEVTEFVNLLYIESLEKVICEDKEFYRLQLGITPSSCAPLRTIADCGVGLFGVYVYRQLRKRLEELNPHTDFKYRQTVNLGGCDC